MAKCVLTGKATTFQNKWSHSHHRTSRPVKANLQRIHIEENGTRKHVIVSVRALRSAKLKRV